MEYFPASYVIVYQRVTSSDIQKHHPNKVVSEGGPKRVFSTHNSITLKRNLRLSGSGEIHQTMMCMSQNFSGPPWSTGLDWREPHKD